MNIKKSVLLISLIAIEYELISMKRTHEQSKNEFQIVSSENYLSKIYRDIVNILEKCQTSDDFLDAYKVIENLKHPDIKDSQNVNKILNIIEKRLENLDFDENNLELDYKFTLYFMIKNKGLKDARGACDSKHYLKTMQMFY